MESNRHVHSLPQDSYTAERVILRFPSSIGSIVAYRLLSSFPPNLAQRVVVLGDVEGQKMVGGEVFLAFDATVNVFFLIVAFKICDRGERERVMRRELTEDRIGAT